jgi:transporter family protein
LTPTALAFLCWGVWAFLPKLTLRYIDPRSAIVYEAVGGLLVAFAALYLVAFKPALDPRGVALAVATGALGVGGALAYLYALRSGPVAPVATLSALYPVLAILLAGLVLREPVSLRQGVGIALGLIAMALIGG